MEKVSWQMACNIIFHSFLIESTSDFLVDFSRPTSNDHYATSTPTTLTQWYFASIKLQELYLIWQKVDSTLWNQLANTFYQWLDGTLQQNTTRIKPNEQHKPTTTQNQKTSQKKTKKLKKKTIRPKKFTKLD